jgi:hypothetical protein
MIAGNYQTDDINAALSWASNAVESYCERSFTQALGDVVRLNPQLDRTALLPNPPVTAVSLVEAWVPLNGAMSWVTLTNYDWTPDGLIWDTSGEVGIPRNGPSWPRLRQSLRVTYDHGYVTTGDGANLPSSIIDAVLKAAARYLANPLNLVERKVGDTTNRWAEYDRTAELDEALLGQYRLVSV